MREVEARAGLEHRPRPRAQFTLVEAAHEDRAQQPGRVIVEQFTTRVGGDEPANLVVRERPAVAFLGCEVAQLHQVCVKAP